jgi:hypothetical protein
MTMKTQPISRRALAAGFALAPVAGLPALAGAVSVDDPIISALAELDRLKAAEKSAEEASLAAHEAFEAARKSIGVVIYKGEEVRSLDRLEFLANRPRLLSDAEWGETIALLKSGRTAQQIEAARPDPEYHTARAALEARLPAYKKSKVESGAAAAEVMVEAAYEEVGYAERAVYEAEPTSRAGAIALLRFAADFLEENGVNDTMLEDVFPDAIRRAADFFEGEA